MAMSRLGKLVALGVAVMVVTAACGNDSNNQTTTEEVATTGPTTTSSTKPLVSTDDDRAVVFGLALYELVTEDNTFEIDHRFTELLVQTHLDPEAGSGPAAKGPGRALTATERRAIENALSDLSPLRWVDDPDLWRTEDRRPVIEGSAIIGVGEAEFVNTDALVPVSLWCGGLCGTWFTYRLAHIDGEWSVTGIEGPIEIS